MMPYAALLSLVFMLAACSLEPAVVEQDGLTLSAVLGGEDTSGYLRAIGPAREFRFPEDHGPHPGFRNEWWYLTGNLETAEGRRFGYQVTWFNTAHPPSATAVPAQTNEVESEWKSERIWMAHAALSDIESGSHQAYERFSRENPGLAGASVSPFRVWLEDWQLAGETNEFPWQLSVHEAGFALKLSLDTAKPPVLQGIDGLSQKSPAAGNASWYYSLTRMPTTGTITTSDGTFVVSGSSWLDREWSTSALAADQSGWDWFSLQFDDGQELMYYQLRDTAGNAHPDSQGNWTDQMAEQTLVTPDQVILEELDSWTSPAGTTYTTAWRMRYADKVWEIRALLDTQWMNLSIPYWEGAVDIFTPDGRRVGKGYLEMVRP